MRENNYSAILTGVLTAFGVWVFGAFGGFSLPNGWAYDQMTRASLTTEASRSLLLIEADRNYRNANDDIWLPVLRNLLASKPRELVFTFMPEQASSKFYRLAWQSKRTVFGRPVLRSGTTAERIELAPLPVGLQGLKLPYGLVTTGSSEFGVYREQPTTILIDGKRWSTLEQVALKVGFRRSRTIPDKTFRVNFSGGEARLPKLGLQRVVAGGLIPEMVKGRVVVIGQLNPPENAWVYTPLSSGNSLTPVAYYHAFALDTLASNRVIKPVCNSGILPILLLLSAIFVVAYQWMSIQLSIWATILAMGSYIFMSWFFLQILEIWLPLVQMMSVQCLLAFFVVRQRAIREEQVMRKMFLDLSGKLKEKAFPTSFYRAPDPWGPIITMVNQILNLNRVIFLERVEGDHRLREIRALNCSVDDIDERRRDYERTPYSTAISEDGPIQVPRNYLKAVDEDEVQFLAPLIYAGDVLGFWAFGIDPEKYAAIPEFNILTKTFSVQISEILHNRRLWQDYHDKQQNRLRSYMRLEGGDTPSHSLKQSITKRERWTSEMFEVFNHLSSASILYDLFGRVVLVNKQMEEYALVSELKPYNMSLLEFIESVTGYSAADSRRLLQYAIFDRENMSVPVITGDGEQSHILHLKPLQKQQIDSVYATQELEEVHPFRLTGILCELVDVAEITTAVSVMEQVYERVSEVTASDIDSVLDDLKNFRINSSSEQQRTRFIDSIREKLTQTSQVLKHLKTEAASMLSQTSEEEIYERTPVDGASSLMETIDEVRKEVAEQNISIRIQTPELLCLVIASPKELRNGFDAILMLMAKDTVEQGKINAIVQQTDDYIFFQFSNDGFGIPNERLQEYLHHDEETVSDELKRLKQLKHQVHRWGGSIDINSKVGEGLRIDLSLQRFV